MGQGIRGGFDDEVHKCQRRFSRVTDSNEPGLLYPNPASSGTGEAALAGLIESPLSPPTRAFQQFFFNPHESLHGQPPAQDAGQGRVRLRRQGVRDENEPALRRLRHGSSESLERLGRDAVRG